MSEEIKKVTDEEIKKAFSVLEELTNEGGEEGITEDLNKGENGKPPVAEEGDDRGGEAEDNIEKGVTPTEISNLFKSFSDDFNSKIQSLGHINKFLVDENESLRKSNEEISKSLGETQKSLEDNQETLGEVLKLTKEMANSPINKIGSSLVKSNAIEKFEKGGDDSEGKQLSVTKDKRKILNMLMKSLDSEEGCKRLGDTVSLVENGLVDQHSFDDVKKSIENEIGGDYKITF